jgi:hypothetical protein
MDDLNVKERLESSGEILTFEKSEKAVRLELSRTVKKRKQPHTDNQDLAALARPSYIPRASSPVATKHLEVVINRLKFEGMIS